MSVSVDNYAITWEKLPNDFVLDNEPVENIDQPLLAAALSESLELAGLLQQEMLVASNFGLCATLNGKIVVKAPDWLYVRSVIPLSHPSQEPRRSYTPHIEGEVPALVMEFLSATEGDEYSVKPTYPPGKWFFYEQVLQVPNYAIFEPVAGLLEVYELNGGRYRLRSPDSSDRYSIEEMQLFLGVWYGTKGQRTGYWLRWWDQTGQMLLWGVELVEQERQIRERMAAKLTQLGVNPKEL